MLTYDECDVLIEAIEKWEEDSDIGGMLLGTMLESMIDDPEAKAKMEREHKEEMRKKEIEKRERKRKAVKLKAKIYDIQEEAFKNEHGMEVEEA